MTKEPCNLIGLQAQLVTPNQKVVLSNSAFLDGYLMQKFQGIHCMKGVHIFWSVSGLDLN